LPPIRRDCISLHTSILLYSVQTQCIFLKKQQYRLIYGRYNEVFKTMEPTIHEFGLALQPQNAQENFSQKVQHSQTGNGYKHKALTHSQTNNQIPAKIKTLNQII